MIVIYLLEHHIHSPGGDTIQGAARQKTSPRFWPGISSNGEDEILKTSIASMQGDMTGLGGRNANSCVPSVIQVAHPPEAVDVPVIGQVEKYLEVRHETFVHALVEPHGPTVGSPSWARLTGSRLSTSKADMSTVPPPQSITCEPDWRLQKKSEQESLLETYTSSCPAVACANGKA